MLNKQKVFSPVTSCRSKISDGRASITSLNLASIQKHQDTQINIITEFPGKMSQRTARDHILMKDKDQFVNTSNHSLDMTPMETNDSNRKQILSHEISLISMRSQKGARKPRRNINEVLFRRSNQNFDSTQLGDFRSLHTKSMRNSPIRDFAQSYANIQFLSHGIGDNKKKAFNLYMGPENRQVSPTHPPAKLPKRASKTGHALRNQLLKSSRHYVEQHSQRFFLTEISQSTNYNGNYNI